MNKFGRSFAKKGGGGLILPAESPRNKAQVGWGYRGAHGGGRYLDWDVPDTSADAAISTGLGGLRARSRDQVQNNPSAASAHQQYAAQLVGSGMMPRPLLKDSGLQREMMELWRVSCNEIDADGDSPFSGMQGIVAMGGFEAGETLARRRVRRIEDGLEVPLQVQLIEGDLLDHHYNRVLSNGNRIRQGIESNRIGKKVAYHLFRSHPGDLFHAESTNNQRVPVPAKDMAHVFWKTRPGQRRGIPALSSALLKLWKLDLYQDAELERKAQAARKVGFIVSQFGEVDPNEVFPTDPDNVEETWIDVRDDYYGKAKGLGIQPGSWSLLGPGDDIRFNDPSDVGEMYEAHVHEVKREIAASGMISFEQMTGDMRGVTYSSARVRLMDLRRYLEMQQLNMLAFMFCRRVWIWWLEAAVASRRLIIPDFNTNRRKYTNVIWVPDAFDSVDPLKDAMSDLLEVRAGFDSRRNKAERRGRDMDTVNTEIERDNEVADTKGFVFDSDPRRTSDNGALQRVQQNQIDEMSQRNSDE